MRRIDFRVWKFGRMTYRTGIETAGDMLIRADRCKGETNPDTKSPNRYEEGVVQQFIGLKDRLGKDIFEGDIVAFDHENGFGKLRDIGIVKYDAPAFILEGWSDPRNRYEYEYQGGGLDQWTRVFIRVDQFGLVIGNIFENPELIRELNRRKRIANKKTK